MSADKYPGIFLRQMEANVYITHDGWPRTWCRVLGQDTSLSQYLPPPSCTGEFNAGVTFHPGGGGGGGMQKKILQVSSCYGN